MENKRGAEEENIRYVMGKKPKEIVKKNDKNETWKVNYGAVLQQTIENKRKMTLQWWKTKSVDGSWE